MQAILQIKQFQLSKLTKYCIMYVKVVGNLTTQARIRLNKYQFADLIDEVDGMCPLCAKELLIRKSGNPYSSTLAEAAHIYPHSPSAQEKITLSGVPRLSDNDESLDNLLMLCPTCHHEFDHPRTREEYLRLYSFLFNNIDNKTIQNILKMYNQYSEKQIFIVLDNYLGTDNEDIDEILRTKTRLYLSGDKMLFGKDWRT